MLFLTLTKFLRHFPKIKVSRKEFIRKMEITYGKRVTLENVFTTNKIKIKHNGKTLMRKPIIKDRKDFRYQNKDKIIDYLYQIIVTHRHYYLKKHYEAYFYFEIQSPSLLFYQKYQPFYPKTL